MDQLSGVALSKAAGRGAPPSVAGSDPSLIRVVEGGKKRYRGSMGVTAEQPPYQLGSPQATAARTPLEK